MNELAKQPAKSPVKDTELSEFVQETYPEVEIEDDSFAQTETTQDETMEFQTEESIFMFDGGHATSKLSENLQNGFIQKVLSIFSVQVLFTYIFVAALIQSSWFHFNIALLGIATLATLAISITLLCFLEVGRAIPVNYILLSCFTLAESYIVACLVQLYQISTAEFTMAFLITSLTFFSIAAYAWWTKKDYTTWGSLRIIMLFSLIMMILSFTTSYQSSYSPIYLTVSFGLSSLYIIYDVQVICGGKHPRLRRISSDDYIVAALLLYTDFIQLLIQILRIMSKKR